MATSNSSEAYSAKENSNISKIADKINAATGGRNFTDTVTATAYDLVISGGQLKVVDGDGNEIISLSGVNTGN